MKEQLYNISVHYADGSGEYFQHASLPYLTDEMLSGTKVLTINHGAQIICLNWDHIRKYWYEAVSEDEVVEE